MQICSQCILPETFPGISFNNQGICNHCQHAERHKTEYEQMTQLDTKFNTLINQLKGESGYDCVVSFSGGKDSSYLLDLIVNRYSLKPLAVTFDNWFLSEMAFNNIKSITKSLNISHILVRPPFGLMKKLFREGSNAQLYSKKSLERASTICTTCISFVRFACIRVALEKDIPMVIFGFNPGQIPIRAGIVRTNQNLLKTMQKAVYVPIKSIVGDEAQSFFLEERHLSSTVRFPYIVNPYAFIDYQEEKIFSRIKQMGWREVSDADSNSTNCQLNQYSNLVYFRQYQFHPYSSEIANMVRKGLLKREEGLRRLTPPQENPMTMKIREQLND